MTVPLVMIWRKALLNLMLKMMILENF